MEDAKTAKRKRVRLHAEARKEQLVSVATRVFAEKGYRAASVTDIVEGAQAGRGTFYLYFDSKRDVFLELIEKYFDGFEGLLRDNHERLQAAARENGNLLETWKDNIVRILEYHRDNPELTTVVYQDAVGRDLDFREKMEELSLTAKKRLTEEFRTMSRHGIIRDCDLEVVTSLVMGATVYAILEHVVIGKRRGLEELASEIIDYHVRALLPEGVSAAEFPPGAGPRQGRAGGKTRSRK